MTRPAAAGTRFVDSLSPDTRARITPIFSPLIKIEPTGAPVDMTGITGAIFTSANGVRFAPPGAGRPAYCVGAATTEAAAQQGWHASQRGDTAADLIDSLRDAPPDGTLLHLSGVHTRGAVAATLSAAGLQVRHIAVYDQTLCPLSPDARQALLHGTPVIVPLFSPRTAQHFAAQAPTLQHAHLVTLSAAVADCSAADTAATLTICAQPTGASMADAIARTVNGLLRVEGRTP